MDPSVATGTHLEQYAWLIILGGWSVLLLLGLAGGDPLAAGQPGREAPAVAFVKWLYGRGHALLAPPAREVPAPRRPTESGLHPVA